MKNEYSISLFETFQSSTLNTREQAQFLFEKIASECITANPILIDFAAIEFISRSFAHEFITLKKEFSFANDCMIYCESVSTEVDTMLQAVSHPIVKKQSSFQQIQLTSIFDLSDYLVSI